MVKTEWRDDPSFPYKHHLYGWSGVTSDEPSERLLASYWLARGKWDWAVFPLAKTAHQAGTSDSEKDAKKEIFKCLGLAPEAKSSNH